MTMKKQIENFAYKELRSDLKQGTLKPLYAFWGEERYLLEHYIGEIRKLIPQGTEEFNHRRFEGKDMSTADLAEALDALPVFSEMTLTEIWDYDFSKASEDARNALYNILSDIPEYAIVVFVFDTVEFKLDGRIKLNAAIKKLFTQVEFKTQAQNELTIWINRHFKAMGKAIDRSAAEHLSFVSGGLMITLDTEIEKLAAYCTGESVTIEDIDAVVIPVLDAAAYELTDALLRNDFDLALRKLGDLFAMNEPPHKILYSISAKLRQLIGAKVCLKCGASTADIMKTLDIRYEFQARNVMEAARKTTMSMCRRMMTQCADTAYMLNSGQGDGGELVLQMLLRMAFDAKRE